MQLPRAIASEISDLSSLETFVDEASDRTERTALGINVAMVVDVVRLADAKVVKLFKSRCRLTSRTAVLESTASQI